MLEFVGLGLFDERSVSERGAAAIAAADAVFLEGYTSVLAGATVDELAAHHGTDIEVLDRASVEQHPDAVLERATSQRVAVLVAGDPMVATTHVDLRLRAAAHGIETNIVHGTSASTAAAGLCGLQARRFGKATTVPRPGQFGDTGVPQSVIETIEANRQRGLHTLVYLDIDLGDGSIDGLEYDELVETLKQRCLDAATATGQLADALPSTLAVVIARAGSDAPLVTADAMDELADGEYGPPLHLVVIPGQLHDLEAEALIEFAGAPTDLVDACRI